jgi:hypothetical protein
LKNEEGNRNIQVMELNFCVYNNVQGIYLHKHGPVTSMPCVECKEQSKSTVYLLHCSRHSFSTKWDNIISLIKDTFNMSEHVVYSVRFPSFL